MRNRDFSLSAPRGVRRSLLVCLTASLALLGAACRTVIEESSYNGLVLGASKNDVMARLDSLPETHEVQPALPGEGKARSPRGSLEPNIVRLAAASVGGGTLTDAEREYLAQYDRWYFEDAEGERAVLLVFADGFLQEIHNRRAGTWLEAIF